MKFKDFLSTREALLSKKSTLPEVVQHYIDVIEKDNNKINAFTQVFPKEAKARAEEVQKKIDDGTAGPLAGAVVGIKEVICQSGKPTTCGSAYLEEFTSVYDATVIERLHEADAVFIGRLNMDEFAMGSSNENSVHGPVKNPLDTNKVPGGSSGGSASAVAANMCNITLGSDTGGSIRQPAAFCGVVGIKPTYGRVSRYGLVAYASSFDCIGPLAHTTADAAEVLKVIAGQDPHDGTTADAEVEDYADLDTEPKKLTVGVPEEYFQEGLDPEIEEAVKNTISKLEEQGATIKSVSLPHSKYSIATYYILATAEASSNLARFDGVRYGHRADTKKIKEEILSQSKEVKKKAKDENWPKEKTDEELKKIDSALIAMYKQSRTEGFGIEVKRRIMLGTYVLSAGYYDAYYGKAQKIRRLIKEDFDAIFQEVDVILGPTTPTTPFELGAKLDDPIQMYLNDIYTISANLAGICGMSLPVAKHSDGMPIGLQLLADVYQEKKLLSTGSYIEQLVNQA